MSCWWGQGRLPGGGGNGEVLSLNLINPYLEHHFLVVQPPLPPLTGMPCVNHVTALTGLDWEGFSLVSCQLLSPPPPPSNPGQALRPPGRCVRKASLTHPFCLQFLTHTSLATLSFVICLHIHPPFPLVSSFDSGAILLSLHSWCRVGVEQACNVCL